jgi:uncharacterized membrane protein YdjX (TVP38/TMEM64 family)
MVEAPGQRRDGVIWPPVLKGMVLLAVLLVCLAAVYLTPLRQILQQLNEINAELRKLGLMGPLAFVLGVAFLVAIGCPRLLLCPIGGLAFGFWEGFLWSQAGTLLGFYATFLFVRWGGQEIVLKRYPKLDHLARVFEESGFTSVLMLRLMPVAGFFVNIILGLTRLRHRDYFLGTILGITPEAIPATLIGSGAAQYSLSLSAKYISVAILCLVSVWVFFGWYVRFSKSKTADTIRKNISYATKR